MLQQATLRCGGFLRPLRVRGVPRILATCGPVLLGHQQEALPTVLGPNLAVDLRDYNCCMMIFGRYSPDLLALLKLLVRPGDSVIDVGAQIGYVTVNLAQLVGPSGCVHSIEPDPACIEYLRRSVLANGYRWVTVLPMAASDAEGRLSLNVSPVLGWSTAVQNSHHRDLKSIEVPCRTLDGLISEGTIKSPVHLVKIDVEGYECTVVDGARALLSKDRPFVIVEVNPLMLAAAGNSPRDLLERFVALGYSLYRFTERGLLVRTGTVELEAVDSRSMLEFCDVLAAPPGASLDRLTLRQS